MMRITLERIYKKKKDNDLLTNAVTKGWITETEKLDIIEMYADI